jgi:hypothetical protein
MRQSSYRVGPRRYSVQYQILGQSGISPEPAGRALAPEYVGFTRTRRNSGSGRGSAPVFPYKFTYFLFTLTPFNPLFLYFLSFLFFLFPPFFFFFFFFLFLFFFSPLLFLLLLYFLSIPTLLTLLCFLFPIVVSSLSSGRKDLSM